MTILEAFSIFDVKADAYMTPFFQPNKYMAIRDFTSLVRQNERIRDYPEDFILYHVGTWDALAGCLSPKEHPEELTKAVDVLKSLQRAES